VAASAGGSMRRSGWSWPGTDQRDRLAPLAARAGYARQGVRREARRQKKRTEQGSRACWERDDVPGRPRDQADVYRCPTHGNVSLSPEESVQAV
jgi:hypothetical protein